MTNNTTADTAANNEWRLVPVTATVEMLKAMSVACGIEPLPTLEEGGDYPITGSQSTIKRSWDAAITLAPVAPDALRAREQGYADQHRRDSQELRRLCAERDEIKAERDTLRAQLEAAEADAARWRFIKAWGRQIEVLSTGECNFGISTPTWRGTWFDLDAAIDAQAATP